MIGQLAPTHLQGVMMGAWMMMTGVAATASNYFSSRMIGSALSNDPLVTNERFSHVFSMLGWMAMLAALILVFLTPLLKRLIKDDTNEQSAQSKALLGI